MNTEVSAAIRRATEQLTWLNLLATTAENHFWTTAAIEFDNLGAVSSNPRDIADDFCAGAEAACEVVLREIALITGATHTPLSWTTSVRSLSTTSAATIVSAIRSIMDTIAALSAPPVGGYTQPPIAGAGGDLYEQAASLIAELGPKFPSPITCFYPDADVSGITLEIEDADHTLLKCTVTGTGSPTWPSGSNWHELAAGDIVLFTALEVSGTGDYVGYASLPLTVSSVSGANLYLDIPDAGALKAAEALTGGTAPGDLFILRKFRGGES